MSCVSKAIFKSCAVSSFGKSTKRFTWTASLHTALLIGFFVTIRWSSLNARWGRLPTFPGEHSFLTLRDGSAPGLSIIAIHCV